MSADKSDKPGEPESLSATGMFLRAFGEDAKTDAEPSDPLARSPFPGPPQPSVKQPAVGSNQAPGEFTQLFQSLEAKPVAPPAPARPETQFHAATPMKASPPMPAEQAGDRGPGEFTRVFVGGVNPPSPPSSHGIEEPTHSIPSPTPSGSRSKGFSAPGVSGSASGEGSFTQVFSATPPSSSGPPAQPAPPNSARNAAWNEDPFFRPPQNPPPADPSSSVTNLIASLGTPSGSGSGGRQEPVPYRPEPIPRSTPLASPEAQVSSEGVTRLIQRLAQTPVEPAPAAPSIAPAVNAGPGDFTRMIARMESTAPIAEPAMAAPPPAAPAAPAFAFPAIPAVPAVPHAAVPAAPKFAPPPASAIPLPPAPKLPVIAAPTLAPPKSKLEAMVPILLVVNTFLLLVLLVVVIFLVKSK